MSNTGVPDDVIKLVMTGTCHLLSLSSALCDGNMSVARREGRKTNDGNLQLPLSCASYTRLLYGKGNDHASLGHDTPSHSFSSERDLDLAKIQARSVEQIAGK